MLARLLDTATKFALFSASGLKDKKLIKKQPARKLKHANFILEYFEYFCQMSSKSIVIILSYDVSKLARFFETQCKYITATRALVGGVFRLLEISTACVVQSLGFGTRLHTFGYMHEFCSRWEVQSKLIAAYRHDFRNKIHVQTNTKSVQCLCINTRHNKVRITQSQWTSRKHAYWHSLQSLSGKWKWGRRMARPWKPPWP